MIIILLLSWTMNGTFILCVNMLCKNPREYLIQPTKIKGGYPKKKRKTERPHQNMYNRSIPLKYYFESALIYIRLYVSQFDEQYM